MVPISSSLEAKRIAPEFFMKISTYQNIRAHTLQMEAQLLFLWSIKRMFSSMTLISAQMKEG